MIVTSKNGMRLDIQVKNKWNPLGWIEFFKIMRDIQTKEIYMDTKDWKFTYGSCKEEDI